MENYVYVFWVICKKNYLFATFLNLFIMTTTAYSLRLMAQNMEAMYQDNLPEYDEDMYRGRNYTLAAAKCFTAAYGAADVQRDNMAMQFYRVALEIADALAPNHPKDVDEHENEIDRELTEQLALNSQLKACHMTIASQYGLLNFLHRKRKAAETDEAFLFVNLFREAHKACRVAHNEAKELRHSPIDVQFAEVVKNAVESIGVFYKKELQLWTEVVKARENGELLELTPDVYIAEIPSQRAQHPTSAVNTMLTNEQSKLDQIAAKRTQLVEQLETLNKQIVQQRETVIKAEETFKRLRDELDRARKTSEKAAGMLSEQSLNRSHLRSKLAVLDSEYFCMYERLQTLVNLRAYASSK